MEKILITTWASRKDILIYHDKVVARSSFSRRREKGGEKIKMQDIYFSTQSEVILTIGRLP